MRIFLTIAAATLLALPTYAQQEGQPTDDLQQQIEGLIEKLDARKFSDRQKSEQALLRIGQAAIPLMQQAVEDAAGEAKIRLQRILTELGRSIRIVEKVPSELLKNVTSVTISSDGRFLYAAAFAANTISVYSIDAETGKLSLVQTITDEKSLKGAVAFRLSPTKPLGIASCYSGRNVTLFSRDESTGKLQQLDVYRGDAQSPTPTFPIEAVFSPNGKFVYVLDCYAKGRNSAGGIMIFRLVDDGKLEWINTFFGEQNCFADIRGIAFHPTKGEMYICSCEPVPFGKRQLGPAGVTISRDGGYVYAAVEGEATIAVFRRDQ